MLGHLNGAQKLQIKLVPTSYFLDCPPIPNWYFLVHPSPLKEVKRTEQKNNISQKISQVSNVRDQIMNKTKIHIDITWCIDINTIEIPRIKFIVRVWPNSAADASPVNIVATVDEYFFKIVSASIITKLNWKTWLEMKRILWIWVILNGCNSQELKTTNELRQSRPKHMLDEPNSRFFISGVPMCYNGSTTIARISRYYSSVTVESPSDKMPP